MNPFQEIPYSNQSNTPREMMRAYIRDFISELRKEKPDSWTPNALSMKYLWLSPNDNNSEANKDIASGLGLSAESVRKKMKEMTGIAIKMLNEDYVYLGLQASSSMRLLFNEFQQELSPIERYSLLNEKYGTIGENRTLRFYLEGLGYTISEQQQQFCYKFLKDKGVDNHFITKVGSGSLIKYLNEASTPLFFDTVVKPHMTSQFKWNAAQCDAMEAYLKVDTETFEWYDKNNAVALHWELIKSFEGKIARILYDWNSSQGWDISFSKNDLLDEYNKRAAHFPTVKRQSVSRQIQAHPHIEALGNSQFRYCPDSSNVKPIDIASQLESLVASNGGLISLDDAIKFVHSINKSYSTNTVLYYLNKANCSQQSINNVIYFIHKDYKNDILKQYGLHAGRMPQCLKTQEVLSFTTSILLNEGRALRIKEELVPLYKQDSGLKSINSASFRNILKKADNILFRFPTGCVELILTKDELEAIDFSSFSNKTGRPAAGDHFNIIRAQTIDLLLSSPGNTLRTIELFNAVKDKYPHEASPNNIYKVFAKMTEDGLLKDIKSGKGGIKQLNLSIYNRLYPSKNSSDIDWESLRARIIKEMKSPELDAHAFNHMLTIMGIDTSLPIDDNNELWRMMGLLAHYYEKGTNENENEFLVWKLFLGIETYLKLYKPISYRKDGLGSYIDELQVTGDLPVRDGTYRVGSVSFDINRLTGIIIKNRNNISHIMNAGKNRPEYLDRNIFIAIKYYLLVAAYGVSKNGKRSQ